MAESSGPENLADVLARLFTSRGWGRKSERVRLEAACAAAVGVSKEHITKTPGVCGGKACIAGHRIRVMDIVVWHEQRGMSPEEIVYAFPGITLADVHAAFAYYFDNRAEI